MIRSTASNPCPVSHDTHRHNYREGIEQQSDARVQEIVNIWLNDPAKCRLADEYRNGCLDDDVYSQTHFALADLGALDWTAIAVGNWSMHVHAVLHRVHSIALRYHQERVDELTERAVAYTDRQRKEADEAETEIRMMLSEVAP
jgi:hypothetical protein